MSKHNESTSSAVQDEITHLLDDLLELARTSTGLDPAKLAEVKQALRDRVESLGSTAQGAAQEAGRRLTDHAEDALQQADRYAHENPWHLVAAAGLVGLAVGVLVARR